LLITGVDEFLNMNVAGFVETNMLIIQLIKLRENIMEIWNESSYKFFMVCLMAGMLNGSFLESYCSF